MDVFIEQCITITNNENKENINIYKNQQQSQETYQQKTKVIFHLGPDKKNAYKSVNFGRWEF
jgi:hypothetical protein